LVFVACAAGCQSHLSFHPFFFPTNKKIGLLFNGEIPEIDFFFPSLSPGGPRADVRGAHQIGFRAGRVRFIGSRWQGLRFPSPFLVFLPAPPLPPQPPPTLPQRRRRSARAGPRRACLNAPRPWAAQGSVCPRLPGAPHRLFPRLLAGGRWATDCCPAHAASACSQGLGALALPNPAPPPPATVFCG